MTTYVVLLPGDEPAGLRLLDGLDLPGHRLPAVRAELLIRAGHRAGSLAAYDVELAALRPRRGDRADDRPQGRRRLAGCVHRRRDVTWVDDSRASGHW